MFAFAGRPFVAALPAVPVMIFAMPVPVAARHKWQKKLETAKVTLDRNPERIVTKHNKIQDIRSNLSSNRCSTMPMIVGCFYLNYIILSIYIYIYVNYYLAAANASQGR